MLRVFLFLSVSFWLVLGTAASAETRIRFVTQGANDDLRDALMSASLVSGAGKNAEAQDMLAAAQADYARLLGVLYENARFGGVISIRVNGKEAASIPPLFPPSAISTVDVVVTPGPIYRFSRAEIGPLAPETALPPEFAQGAPARTTTIETTARAATEAWRSNGFAKAEISDQRLTAQHGDATLSAQLSIAPGPRLRFGETSISGNQAVRIRRIETIAGLPEGRVFDPEEVARVTARLRRTGAFSAVTVSEAETIGPNDTLPMRIEVTEAIPRRFGFGAEYSTVEGATLSGFWLHRNLLGGAEQLRFDAEVSGLGGETGGIDGSLGLRYERPATPRADIDLFSELQFATLNEPDESADTASFELGFTRYATDSLIVDFGLGYVFADTEDAFGQETYHLLTLPKAAELDRRDDSLNARSGYYVDLTVTPFLGLEGTSNGTQVTLDSRAYVSTERLTFAGRAQLGALFGPSLAEAPSIYRFYSGGGGTVRGQSYDSLGVDFAGSTVGGRSFLGLSGELRQSVTDDIQIVGFADWGYIGAESFPDFSGNSHAGAGLGLRYDTGLGPIRLDIATPISGSEDGTNLFIYVGIGQAF